ncbi:uncharacterized protein SAPINGB_P001561 [Magnusiomyces paraingens]|uniref:Pterin-binding domain-containing protein n=1 Tax=Magnusiomyces paraingens TaxID=2606893 RepID=A0A5E8B6L1_9ASCO|nr:uncharacterized protein SAPINGB_P001561 [Saprochaete ingens]VVT47137.1 unnamed protein product [Saprochaete ingens]
MMSSSLAPRPATTGSIQQPSVAILTAEQTPDLVFVRDLSVKALTGVDAWHRPEPQPVTISVWLRTSVAQAGSTDHLTYSLNYAVITRKVTKMVETSRFKSLEDIAERVASTVLSDSVGGQWAKIQVRKPRALLRADASEIVITRMRLDQKSKLDIPPSKFKTVSDARQNLLGIDHETSSVKSPAETFDVVKVPGSIDTVRIHNLRLVTIIGVNTIERMHKQNVILDLTLYKTNKSFGIAPGLFDKAYDFRKVVQVVTDHVEDSSYKTVEAFVTSVAQVICQAGVAKVTVRAEKPSALTFADAAGVEVTRTKEYFDDEEKGAVTVVSVNESAEKPLFPDSVNDDDGVEHIVFIAFGSNVGNSLSVIKAAIDQLKARDIAVLETSAIYESDPMYVTDQPKFYNGVFKARTSLAPLKLLQTLKELEYGDFGKRVKIQDNGPRSLDLDILLYDDWAINLPPTLTIPHLRMLERNFVLRPLKDLVGPDQVHPLTAEPYHSHLEQLLATAPDTTVQASSVLRSVVPLPALKDSPERDRSIIFDPDTHRVATHVMAILNTTPDSFSDGGRFVESDGINVDKIVQAAVEAVDAGATILDIGGMSTRPGTSEDDVTVDEEIARVVGPIAAIRARFAGIPKYQDVVISIDTYRAAVARAAVEAGADMINDIGAGSLDPDMFATARDLSVPIILNHTRGTPATMASLARYEYVDAESGAVEVDTARAVVESVAEELEDRVACALESGLCRWQIILDPGIGFAKTLRHNVLLLRKFDALRKARGGVLAGYPWLVGTSRKRFISKLTGDDESARVFGTAATVSAAIEQGADIVRVHDVAAMVGVARVSDAIYRDVY